MTGVEKYRFTSFARMPIMSSFRGPAAASSLNVNGLCVDVLVNTGEDIVSVLDCD